MSRNDAVLDKINEIREIVEKQPVGTYIYRGESEHYMDVSSNLYRFCRDNKLPIARFTGIKDLLEHSLRKFKRFNVEDEISEFADMTQHYGGLTDRIDFTSDYLIALFFACYGSPDKKGRVIILEQDKMRFPGGEGYCKIRPLEASNNRIISQKSIFVIPSDGFINLERDGILTVNIPKHLKRDILGFLQKHHGISVETIYGDFAGVIRLQRVYLEATAYYLQGNTCILEDKHDPAIKKFNEAIKRDPYYAEAFQGRGIAHAYKEEYKPAIENLNEAIEMSQYNAKAYLSRGNVYAKIGDYKKAIADIEKSNYELITTDEEVVYRIYLSLGNAYAKIKEYDKAIKIFNHAIQRLPDLYDPAGWRPSDDTYDLAAALHYNLGNVFLKMDQQKMDQHENTVIGCLDNAIKWSRYNSQRKSYLYLYLSMAHMKINRCRKAIEYADKAIDPLSSYVHYLIRGNFYAKIGEYQKALDDLNEAVKELKTLPLRCFYQGCFLAKIGCVQYAINNFSMAIDLLRDRCKWIIAALCNRYDVYLKTGNNEKADEDFNEVKELVPELDMNSPPTFLFFIDIVRCKPDIYFPSSLYGWEVDLSV